MEYFKHSNIIWFPPHSKGSGLTEYIFVAVEYVVLALI